MADTLLIFLLAGIGIFLFLLAVSNPKKYRAKMMTIAGGLCFLVGFVLFLNTGYQKIKADVSRLITNSAPKSPAKIYAVLFPGLSSACVKILNLKDQQIPRLDCCIWMEVMVCPTEIERISALKSYKVDVRSNKDSILFLTPFSDRPVWWTPQTLNQNLTVLSYETRPGKQQTIFVNADSSRIFICDQAM